MDLAFERLEYAVERSTSDPDDLANVVALLAVNVRTQRDALHAVVERFSVR